MTEKNDINNSMIRLFESMKRYYIKTTKIDNKITFRNKII